MRKLEDIIAEENREDPRDLRSRGDARRERQQEETRLAELAQRLVATSERLLGALALPEPVLDAVLDGRRIKSPVAAKRQIRRIRAELRAADALQIEARLEAHVAPGGRSAAATRASEHWCTRLVEEGDAALDELLSSFPAGERQHLRQLTRRLSSARAEEQPRARRALLLAVREAIETGATSSEAAS